MATWKTRGLRGSTLEQMINYTLEAYREKHLALIQKIPTPITPVHMDQATRHIDLAYFDQRSTVDYIGVVQGVPVCFDAKECASDTVPLRNIHEHQIQFMREYEDQGGISFILLMLTHRNAFYYIPLRDLNRFWERAEHGGRMSFTYDEIDQEYRVESAHGLLIHFLPQLQQDLSSR